jgi:hypothetical protein
MIISEEIRKRRNAETGQGGRSERRPIIGFESPLLMNGDRPSISDEPPRRLHPIPRSLAVGHRDVSEMQASSTNGLRRSLLVARILP